MQKIGPQAPFMWPQYYPPARVSYEQSILKIMVIGNDYNYRRPWDGPMEQQWSGSGFVLQFQEQYCIVTNAHVVADAAMIEVRVAQEDKKYCATVRNIDHDCDLALLTISDNEFWNRVKPLSLSAVMPGREDKLKVLGFPIGGSEMCMTKGIVSRNEVREYVHSDVELLLTQISAEVNAGNSGGPALMHDKVVGVAFENLHNADGVGYMIPLPVLLHFLNDALSGSLYLGFPNLGFEFQTLDNGYMREGFNLKPNHTGVRIQSVDPLSSCATKLEVDDILLAIDGVKIQDDATVDTAIGNHLKFIHLVRSKYIGDTIELQVLRKGLLYKFLITLQERTNTTKLAQKEWDKAPSYFIHSGIVFAPISAFSNKKYAKKPKRTYFEEKVHILNIFSTEHTRWIDKSFEGKIILAINDEKISHLRHAIEILEKNKKPLQKILTKDGSILFIKNLSQKENDEIMKKYKILSDRSDDLRQARVVPVGMPEYSCFTPLYKKEANLNKTDNILKTDKWAKATTPKIHL